MSFAGDVALDAMLSPPQRQATPIAPRLGLFYHCFPCSSAPGTDDRLLDSN
jgi:hypothetical protein